MFAAPFFILSGYEYKKEYLKRQADKIKEEVERDSQVHLNNLATPMS